MHDTYQINCIILPEDNEAMHNIFMEVVKSTEECHHWKMGSFMPRGGSKKITAATAKQSTGDDPVVSIMNRFDAGEDPNDGETGLSR